MTRGFTTLQQKGFTLWFTGLPCSGKTTLSRAIGQRLTRMGHRVVHLDGDRVRKNLCSDLSFSKKDRDANVARVAFVAKILTENGLIALVSLVSPYERMRQQARREIGSFVEVYVRCALSSCERRDVKGMYKLARKGAIKSFTGVSDPYEEPIRPEVTVDTDRFDETYCAERILEALRRKEWTLPENPFPKNKLFTAAFKLAAHHHRGQERKGGDVYLSHPVRVARLLEEAGLKDETVAAGFLHDVLEDTGCEKEEMERSVGGRVTSIVLEVTEKDKTVPWKKRKAGYLAALKIASKDALNVACADKIDNIESLASGQKKSGKKFMKNFSADLGRKLSNYRTVQKLIRARHPACPLLGRLDQSLDRLESSPRI